MPREKSSSRTDLLDNAMKAFWKIGFHVISVSDLVRETGVSRAGIYSDHANKKELFHACLDRYEEIVVDPLFSSVEKADSGIEDIRAYLEALLKRFEANPGAGIGCLVGNTFTQLTSDDDETRDKILQFYERLTDGYRNALTNENRQDRRLSKTEIDDLASYAMISVQGLWSYSRLTQDSAVLRQYTETLIVVLEMRLHGG
nr:TetR/AcrR family transcriptional regulator [Granulosicoccus antarcticus]